MKKKSTAVMLCLLGVAGICGFAQAGDLEPGAPPGSTMHTLEEIFDKLDECTGGSPCGVPKTGQTGCWDESGTPIDCAGTGQDGEYQAGVSATPRFTDNGDGTVTDNLTGLIWLQNANCSGTLNWPDALSEMTWMSDGACGLTDGSELGDWRLPNVKELQSLIDYGQQDPALPAGHPFSGVQLTYYWSSTTYGSYPDNAWYVYFHQGHVYDGDKTDTRYVWPVRGGQ